MEENITNNDDTGKQPIIPLKTEGKPNTQKRNNTSKPRKKKKTSRKAAAKRRNMLIAAACAIIGVAILALGLIYVSRRLHKPQIVVLKKEYPISGIDISSHNGYINFSKVAADSITFVYIKASEGTDFRDRRFQANCDSAGHAGLKVGAYHFFRKNGNGAAQARNFLDAVAGKMLDLPLVIDVEDWGNVEAERTAVVHNLREMIATLESHGSRVMIYTNKDGYRSYIRDHFEHLDLWLCTFSHPRKVKGYNWTILQYSHWGNVAGTTGDVDLNVFNGDSLQWEEWLRKR